MDPFDGTALATTRTDAEAAVTIQPAALAAVQRQLQAFLLEYECGLREIETKISILSDEFQLMHDYNPIEHVTSRVKTPESIMAKASRKGIARDLDAIRTRIWDIAGLRITCSFVADVYRLFDLLTDQDDITVVEVRDYIARPKPNGYMSLHAIVTVPVFLSTGAVEVPVEVQFRTIAMDFWASLEHKIYYKYDKDVPRHLVDSLKLAADVAWSLDTSMERIHDEVHALDDPARSAADGRYAAVQGLGAVAEALVPGTVDGARYSDTWSSESSGPSS